ncbi:uncharacterized protein MCYG_07665 [Microsporum canis CBS 113480]|uniref:Uncharacterized protein n=1 Tax=Arthroderma otae (strain ATCC MYA-4605 / CBS 113480) TaxID=554155 RepID=C5FX06_ARTOC|nr:uncharacterized protein MCYG_07665 [Microsporum canis CBS 113480]EEQ34846.1 predicted protein [Microsporum canis CBS 113480]
MFQDLRTFMLKRSRFIGWSFNLGMSLGERIQLRGITLGYSQIPVAALSLQDPDTQSETPSSLVLRELVYFCLDIMMAFTGQHMVNLDDGDDLGYSMGTE